jgi:hypothetical protein
LEAELSADAAEGDLARRAHSAKRPRRHAQVLGRYLQVDERLAGGELADDRGQFCELLGDVGERRVGAHVEQDPASSLCCSSNVLPHQWHSSCTQEQLQW